MKMGYLTGLSTAAFVVAMTACGGGGGATVTTVTTTPPPTTMTVKLSTIAKTGENPQIKGITVSLLLPDGVTLKTESATKQTANGVVRYSGAAAFSNLTSQLVPSPLFGIFSTARSPGKSKVTISFIGPIAFGPGEFATVTCDVAGGMTVTENGFQVVDFHAIGDSASLLADDLTVQFDTPMITSVK